jgi:hypothetical protein
MNPALGPRTPEVGRRLRASEAGAAAVEMALVLPILLFILTGIIQFGMVLFTHNNMLHVAQEASRRVSVGTTTPLEVTGWIEERLIGNAANFGITVEEVINAGDDDIVVTITVPLSAAAVVDPFKIFPDTLIQARAVVRRQ